MGPFALAYLETLIRAADGRTSKTPPADRKTLKVNQMIFTA